MKVALFGGSFDPVHSQHVALVKAAVSSLGLDRVIVTPSYTAPHKRDGARAEGAHRLEMCRLAFLDEPRVTVSGYELEAGGTSYSYLTCRNFARQYPQAERYFLVGADMLENFFFWKEPDDILSNVTLVACGRGNEGVSALHRKFKERFSADFLELPFTGGEVSSTQLIVSLNFEGYCNVRGLSELPPPVREYIAEKRLYVHEAARALGLEREPRREHSYRVALLACRRAKSLSVPFEKALLAAMLHDCGKYVPLSSPLLQGFVPPEGVPEPVLHQYTGAYLAEKAFGIGDEEVLGAIRFHTSGKENMTKLEKLIYLADLLEEGRTFEGADGLRELFERDLDACLAAALAHEMKYLRGTGKPIYPLTERAFLYYSAR